MSSEKPPFHDPLPRSAPKRPGPKGGKRDTNRRIRLQSIRDAALPLFLEKGVEGTTIDDIVGSAQLAKGSFYRYYEDKTDLVRALFEPLGNVLDEAGRACARALGSAQSATELFSAYEGLAAALTQLVVENNQLVLLYLQENRAPAVGARVPIRKLADQLSALAVELTQIAQQHKLVRDLPPHVSALGVVGAGERLLFAFLSGEEIGSPVDVTEGLISMVLEGVRRPELAPAD